ncbi:hypothetical protein POM88_029366 [Heracleum sosnowskyi]|uniref:Transposase n=1 Tax=Heracleum sosnowskyi TaxID=360622 RepID=A0AAD8MIE6_9APIA|nr:hypothetical protein POM88_029366 [Heracleum sosnowskyi]
MDRHTWMYKISRATQEYIDGVEKFIQCAEENLKKKKEHGKEDRITCPCHDCYNLKKYSSVATIREHLFRRGFMAGYTKWIWHGEGIHSEKTRTSDGNRRSNEDSMPTNKEDDAENDKINEMIEDVEDLLVHQPKILENLVDDSKKLLKVIDPMTLDKLQADIIETLCEFEIFLCILKAYVRNRRLPEASIVEGYSVEETIEFCTDYLASVDPVGIPRSRHEGRLEGQGTLGHKMISPSAEICERAHLFVLQHMTEVNHYLQEHIGLIRQMHPSKSGKWITNEHNRTFVKWFKDRVMSQYSESPTTISNTLKWLAYGPDIPVTSYEGYDVNGYTFYTQCQDNKSTVQNSGVCVEASSTEFDRGKSITSRDIKKSYYGVIEEIWELDYKDFKVTLFRCKWFDDGRGVRVDESGFTLVDFIRFGHVDDPFIFATQVNQVFYIRDPADSRWSIVLQSKRRILGIDNVEDEDEYNQFDENPPFSIGLPTRLRDDNIDINYARSDHQEGLWIDGQESFPMDENSGNTQPSSSEVSRKRTRGPTLCKKLKKRITNQNLECSISFNEFGRPIGDMLKDFRIYLGSVVRCQVDINIESWDLVNQGLKDAIWDDIKVRIPMQHSFSFCVKGLMSKPYRIFAYYSSDCS